MKISLFYKNVTVLDYAYLDDHKGVVGDALKVHVEFIGKTDKEGVVYDFSYAKKTVKEIIDRDCDHRLVVPKGAFNQEGDVCALNYAYGLNEERVVYECPREALCELPFRQVNKATIQSYLEDIILQEMPETVSAVRITLEDEMLPVNKATFHYTHGLKEHYGNCQRLFHGHKNTVDVYVNNQNRPEIEEYLATELFKGSIHFCKWENVVNKETILEQIGPGDVQGVYSQIPLVEIEYTSAQGRFYGVLPGRAVFFMSEESTVENLSMLFARLVKELVEDEDIVRVHAYEGVAKGAISTL